MQCRCGVSLLLVASDARTIEISKLYHLPLVRRVYFRQENFEARAIIWRRMEASTEKENPYFYTHQHTP